MVNIKAEFGKVYVCVLCGKRSKDLYGELWMNRGWDESCVLNAVLCDEDKLEIEDDLVVNIIESGLAPEELEKFHRIVGEL